MVKLQTVFNLPWVIPSWMSLFPIGFLKHITSQICIIIICWYFDITSSVLSCAGFTPEMTSRVDLGQSWTLWGSGRLPSILTTRPWPTPVMPVMQWEVQGWGHLTIYTSFAPPEDSLVSEEILSYLYGCHLEALLQTQQYKTERTAAKD